MRAWGGEGKEARSGGKKAHGRGRVWRDCVGEEGRREEESLMGCELGRGVAGADVQGYDWGLEIAFEWPVRKSFESIGGSVSRTTHSTKVVRAAGFSVSNAVSSSATSSPGASATPVSPTSITSALSPPCISTSADSSATPPEIRTSGSAMIDVCKASTSIFSFCAITWNECWKNCRINRVSNDQTNARKRQ